MKIQSKFNIIALVFVLLFSVFAGCASKEENARMTVSYILPMMANVKKVANRHFDPDLVKTTLPFSIMQTDSFIEVSPNSPRLLLHAAEVNSGYAFLFLLNSDKRRALIRYEKSKEYAFRALRHKNAFKKVLKTGSEKKITKFMARYKKEDVPALYFFTLSWLGCIELTAANDAKVISELPKVECVLQKMLKIDETYNYGAIHALLGTYFSSPNSPFVKQKDARFHFMEAFKISESKFLAWKFLYAQNYAVYTHDRELFIKTLNDIISAPDNLLPEKTFVNEAIKLNAKVLLSEVENNF